MVQLLRKRHPSTRHILFLDTATSNPVSTISWTGRLSTVEDIKDVHVSDDGTDLSANPSASVSILTPRDWSDIAQYLYTTEYSVDVPTYYTLVNNGSLYMEVWMTDVPAVGGTNSLRMMVHGIPEWTEVDNAVPSSPPKYDQFIINQAAIHMRSDKQIEANDLIQLNQPMWVELVKEQGQPKIAKDYKMPVVGAVANRLKSGATRQGSVRRY
jgi:hypothetical protein